MPTRFSRETAIVRPLDLPKDRASSPGAALSEGFLSSVALAFGADIVGTDVYFDLSRLGWATPAEIVTLACAIRAVAERGTPCSVKFPDDPNSRLLWTLKSYRFAHALGAISQTEAWHKRIRFENFSPANSDPGALNDTKRVLPISWIDLSTFGYDRVPPNLYMEEPEFNPAYTRFIRAVLTRHGFVAEDAIDDLVRGILREIGWNAVLHSNKGKPGGFAAFAGQVFPQNNSLHFALADTGCGIASNLLDRYRAARKAGTVPAYERQYGCSESTAAVRYAIEPGSTSRTAFPSEYDIFSDRGLALVAEIVQESGDFTLVSSGAAINVGSKGGEAITVGALSTNLPWTCLYGSLSARSKEPTKSPKSAKDDIEDEVRNADYYPAAVLLRRSHPPSVGVIQRIRRRMGYTSRCAIVDVGFLDKSARVVENGIVTLIQAIAPTCLTIVNVRSRRVSPIRILRAMKQVGLNNPLTIRISMAGQSKLQELHISADDYEKDTQRGLNWHPIFLDDRQTCAMHFRSNNAFLENSFGRDGTRYGFYRGRVHLLSGNVADRYFSLIAHTQADGGESSLRWTDAFGRLLDIVLSDTENATAKVIGFAASMRPILASLDKAHPIRDETYCLLSYDAPSKAELAEIVKPGNQIVLCTDVISTGSLLHEMVALIRRIGGTVIGIISLVDARAKPADTWETLFEPEVEGIPLYLASSLRRSVIRAGEGEGSEYWVDAVSAVPMSLIPESFVDLKRVLDTVDLLSEAHSVTLGHFVSGLRHTAVRIDMFKLLSKSEQISMLTAGKLRELFTKEEWRTFQPRVALVPAGIHRIDKLNASYDAGGGKPSSEIYAEIVCDSFHGHPQIISVPRAFEPGGQAKCAALGNIGALHDLSDVLIVDDGVSSGGTVRSLVHQAVRAGAKRILVCALLARMTPEELDQWALTREVADEAISGSALVSLVHPLHLPIPFAGESDCPQCTTLNSIGSRVSGQASSKGGWKAIQEDLTAPYEYVPSGNSNTYISTWLRVHSLAEIASRSVQGLEILKSFLQALTADDTDDVNVKREAVVRLFLVKWRLLGRARLRQVIRRSVAEIVFKQLDSREIDERRFIEALSLVRSMFPDDYTRVVKSVKVNIITSEPILRRVLFHLGTLNSMEWELERMDVLRQLIDSLSSSTNIEENKKRRHQNLIENVANDLGRTSQGADVAYRIRALMLALSGAEIVHDAIGPLAEIASIDPNRVERFREDGYFGPLTRQVEGDVIPAVERLYPLLRGQGELLGIQLQHLRLQDELQRSYFEIGNDPEVRSIDHDIESVRHGCRNVEAGVHVRSSLKTAMNAASNVLSRALLPTSALQQVLNSLTSLTIASIMSLLENSLRGFLPDSTIHIERVSCHEQGEHNGDTHVLCPESFVIKFFTLAKQNLQKHVLDVGIAGSSLRLSISVGFMSTGHRDYAVFRLANSGPQPDPAASARYHSRRFDKKLALVDGHFVPAEPGCNGYGAATSLKLRIYNGKT